MKICGIDEAGRGPVIGAMVIAGLMIEEGEEEKLKNLEVKDSKLIAPKKRDRIAAALTEYYKHEIIVIEPAEIDKYIGTDGTNLNWLEADKTVEILKKLKPDKAYIDSPSPNLKAYKAYIAERVKKVELRCEHKADVNYLVCGAASILAKSKREEIVANLRKKYGDFGSGYMTDPKTKAFLEKNWNKHPELFRKSWETYKNIIRDKKQQKLQAF